MMAKKKRDTALTTAGAGNNPAPTASLTNVAVNIQASTTASFLTGIHSFLYQPTYRFLSPNNADYVALRTSTKPYLKGLSERYDISPNDSSVWYWRRIVFATKDRSIFPSGFQATIGAQTTSGGGSARPLRDMSGQTSGDYQTVLTSLVDRVFNGVYTTDWYDVFTATIDRTRITPISDKFRRITSGNAAPSPRVMKTYVPINKTIVYDDEENGTSMSVSPLSTEAKPGIGDVFVWDIIGCPVPLSPAAGAGQTGLSFGATSTLYWHEK